MLRAMAQRLSISSTRKMPSGYEIPLLGFGVCLVSKSPKQLLTYLRHIKCTLWIISPN